MSFLEEYTDLCIKKGQITPAQIISQAREDLLSLEEEVKKIEILKERQLSLRSIIRSLGGKENNQKKKVSIKSFDSSSELTGELKQICIKVCDFIEIKDPQPQKPRDIMDNVSSLEENKIVLMAIKYLWDHAILERNEKSLSREISKGKNWGNRPREA